MASHIEIGWRDGVLSSIRVHDAVVECVTDCRQTTYPFVSVNFKHGTQSIAVFLSPEEAKVLHDRLHDLFAEDEQRPVDFPAAVDPVAAIERSGSDG